MHALTVSLFNQSERKYFLLIPIFDFEILEHTSQHQVLIQTETKEVALKLLHL